MKKPRPPALTIEQTWIVNWTDERRTKYQLPLSEHVMLIVHLPNPLGDYHKNGSIFLRIKMGDYSDTLMECIAHGEEHKIEQSDPEWERNLAGMCSDELMEKIKEENAAAPNFSQPKKVGPISNGSCLFREFTEKKHVVHVHGLYEQNKYSRKTLFLKTVSENHAEKHRIHTSIALVFEPIVA